MTPVRSYGIELWDSAKLFNSNKIQEFQQVVQSWVVRRSHYLRHTIVCFQRHVPR